MRSLCPRITPAGALPKRPILLQLSRIAHDHGERRADIVGYARDPSGTGRIALFKGRVLAPELLGGAVDVLRKLSQRALHGHLSGGLVRQPLDAAGQLAQGPE